MNPKRLLTICMISMVVFVPLFFLVQLIPTIWLLELSVRLLLLYPMVLFACCLFISKAMQLSPIVRLLFRLLVLLLCAAMAYLLIHYCQPEAAVSLFIVNAPLLIMAILIEEFSVILYSILFKLNAPILHNRKWVVFSIIWLLLYTVLLSFVPAIPLSFVALLVYLIVTDVLMRTFFNYSSYHRKSVAIMKQSELSPAETIELLKEALYKNPKKTINKPPFLIEYSKILSKERAFSQAIDYLTHKLDDESLSFRDKSALLFQIALNYSYAGNYTQALSLFGHIIKDYRINLKNRLIDVGVVYALSGDTSMARYYQRQAANYYAPLDCVQFLEGLTLIYENKSYEKAYRIFQKLAKEQATQPFYPYYMGLINEQNDDLASAKAYYTTAYQYRHNMLFDKIVLDLTDKYESSQYW